MKKTAILFFFLLPVVVYSDSFFLPETPLDHVLAGHFDSHFDIQKWFLVRHCFLAYQNIEGKRPADIIRRWCRYYDLDARWVLCRMQLEYSILSGTLDGKYYVFGFKKKKQRRLWKYVQQELCGVGLVLAIHGRKYAGFERQIKACCEITRRDWKKYHWAPFVIFNYDDKSVRDFFEIFLWLWPHEFDGFEYKGLVKLVMNQKQIKGKGGNSHEKDYLCFVPGD